MTQGRLTSLGLIDLHVHTVASDSPISPQMLIGQAKRRGIRWLATTDHETMASCSDVAALASRAGIHFIRGVEIAARLSGGRVVHILGYGIRPELAPVLEEFLAPVRRARTSCSREAVHRLKAMGYDVGWPGVLAHVRGPSVFRVHVMHALMDAGYTNRLKGQLYRELSLPGGPLSMGPGAVSAREAIGAIHSGGGVAVLAHPGMCGALGTVEELVRLGLDGIEVYHPAHRPAAVKRAMDVADRYDLLVTGGSDYHGAYGDYEGLLGCPDLGMRQLKALMERIERHGGLACEPLSNRSARRRRDLRLRDPQEPLPFSKDSRPAARRSDRVRGTSGRATLSRSHSG